MSSRDAHLAHHLLPPYSRPRARPGTAIRLRYNFPGKSSSVLATGIAQGARTGEHPPVVPDVFTWHSEPPGDTYRGTRLLLTTRGRSAPIHRAQTRAAARILGHPPPLPRQRDPAALGAGTREGHPRWGTRDGAPAGTAGGVRESRCAPARCPPDTCEPRRPGRPHSPAAASSSAAERSRR